MNANLIITDSYFNIFPLLADKLKGKVNDLTHKNYVFCEEKLSLMTERFIVKEFGGTFNTEVYSFGNYLRANKKAERLLSKEGSCMAIKKLTENIPFKCFNRAKTDLAPALFELISQLKSAKVSPEEVLRAEKSTQGILSAKLADISAVYSAYERYLVENNLSDQSSALNVLPEIIEKDEQMQNAEVFIVGFSGLTMQIRKSISAILSRSKSCTAILTGGENGFAFVNEPADVFRRLCAEKALKCSVVKAASDYSVGGKIIKDGLFNPIYRLKDAGTKKPEAFFVAAKSVRAETERIAEVIKRKVMSGECRYGDFTLIAPQSEEYAEAIKSAFFSLEIPYFLDEKKRPENFPLVSLIYAYCDAFIRGLKIPVLAAFFKNPYVCSDRDFADRFENYLYKYDVRYGKFKKPFVFADALKNKDEFLRFEEFRKHVASFFEEFNVETLLSRLNADDVTERLSERLKSLGEKENAEVNGQVFKKIKELLGEIKLISGSEQLSPEEFRKIFSGGMAAMEISVIPQYKDAVFVGNFKQAAVAKAKYLFAAGLTDKIPEYREDVALLSDGDIDALNRIKVLVEPKINVVNHRMREETALGLSAYEKGLYLSYPLSDVSGTQTVKSEILTFTERFFEIKKFPPYEGYITKKQGMRSFSRDCSRFASLYLDDFSAQSAFYAATLGAPERIVNYANKEIKVRLNGKEGALLRGVVSPTAIEDYYSCPYRSFMLHTLKVKEKDDGKVNALSVGNLMHEIFKDFVKKAGRAKDETAAKNLFSEISKEVTGREEYRKFDDAESAFNVELALKECEKYCLQLFDWQNRSLYKNKSTEIVFGDGVKDEYSAVNLLGGKVKLSGKIDRVDEYKNLYRIIDYKTGGKQVGDEEIYAGVKLQLYLYSLAITDKTLAGAYYLRINDEYKNSDDKPKTLLEGKTATGNFTDDCGNFETAPTEEGFISLSGKNSAVEFSELAGVKQYVLKMAEQAAQQLSEGVIVPSPYGNVCEYCKFSPMCRGGLESRKVSADTAYIAESARVTSDCAEEKGENR